MVRTGNHTRVWIPKRGRRSDAYNPWGVTPSSPSSSFSPEAHESGTSLKSSRTCFAFVTRTLTSLSLYHPCCRWRTFFGTKLHIAVTVTFRCHNELVSLRCSPPPLHPSCPSNSLWGQALAWTVSKLLCRPVVQQRCFGPVPPPAAHLPAIQP